MKKWISIPLLLILTILLPLNTYAATFDDVKYIIEHDYVGEIDGDLDKAKTVDEMIEMLDPYSAYFTEEEYQSFINSIDNTTVGIGVVIQKHEKGILIMDVMENGSAFNYGLEDGDIITKVNDMSTVDMTIEQASSLIQGKQGTSVNITVLKGNGSTQTLSIIRKPFTVQNVTAQLLYGNVGYIQMTSFTNNGADEVKAALEKLTSQGAVSFILDLQNNGGGYVSTAEELIGMFPNASHAYKLKEASGTTLYPSIYQASKFPINTRLLVNRYSASASEMTAAALRDQNAALIYGEQTYGKGTMQGFYTLSEGRLKLTIAEFTGPKDTIVNKIGVTPHIQTTSNPIYQAHYDAIKENLTKYKELKSLKEVPTTKSFTLNFNRSVAADFDPKAVELVALGGQTVDIAIETKGTQLFITPKSPLIAGAEYMLVIHPSIYDEDGKQLKSGSYLHVTVGNE